MELRPGFKITEVGVIPEDWSVVSLVELVDESRGIRYGIVQPGQFDPQGRFLIRGQDYSKGWVDSSQLFKVTSVVEERYRNARVRAGDLIITIVGAGTGHVEVIPDWLDGANLTQTTARIAIDKKKGDSRFFKMVLQSTFGKNQVAGYIKGAAQPGLNCGDVEKFLLPIPQLLPEQEAIAEVLSDTDALIESLEQLITKKRHIKQGAMQELLTGKKRLPGFSGEWEVKRLDAVCSMKSGEGITSDDIDEGSAFPCFGGNGLRGYAKSYTHDGNYALIGRQGALCGNVLGVNGKFFASEHAIVVTPYTQTDIVWLTFILGKMNLNQYSESSAQPGLSVSKLLDLPVDCPPTKPEQTAIATILSDMDAEITTLETRLAKTRQLKQGMMHNLLTGRIRLI